MSSSAPAATSNTTNTTQPAYCYYSRDAFPSLPDTPKYYAEVPLYQTVNPDENMTTILQGCCQSKVWLYSNPSPCTAVCNMTTEKQAQDLSYCLNAKNIDYGGHLKDSGVDALRAGSWSILLVTALVVSGMML